MMIDVVSCFVGGRKPLRTPIPARFVHVVSVQYRLVTDGRTDRRTDGLTHDDSIYRAYIGGAVKRCIYQSVPKVTINDTIKCFFLKLQSAF